MSEEEAEQWIEKEIRKAVNSKLPVINDFFHVLRHAWIVCSTRSLDWIHRKTKQRELSWVRNNHRWERSAHRLISSTFILAPQKKSLGNKPTQNRIKAKKERFWNLLQSYWIWNMEVLIDYFGDEYPVLIRPDKTVKENKKEIAVWHSGVVFWSRTISQSKRNTSSCISERKS